MKRSIILIPVLLVAACGANSVTKTLGLEPNSPDEFKVTTRAPLSVPPDLTADSLSLPTPGLARPQEMPLTEQAKLALAPQLALQQAAPRTPSAGQTALVGAAGPAAPAGIRAEVAADSAQDSADESVTERLMFWHTPTKSSTLVDAKGEAARLQNDQALGKPVTTGDTPVIAHKKHKFLWIF